MAESITNCGEGCQPPRTPWLCGPAARALRAAGAGAGLKGGGERDGIEPSAPALGRFRAQSKVPSPQGKSRRQLSRFGGPTSLHVSVDFRTFKYLSGKISVGTWVTKFVIDSKKLWLPL